MTLNEKPDGSQKERRLFGRTIPLSQNVKAPEPPGGPILPEGKLTIEPAIQEPSVRRLNQKTEPRSVSTDLEKAGREYLAKKIRAIIGLVSLGGLLTVLLLNQNPSFSAGLRAMWHDIQTKIGLVTATPEATSVPAEATARPAESAYTPMEPSLNLGTPAPPVEATETASPQPTQTEIPLVPLENQILHEESVDKNLSKRKIQISNKYPGFITFTVKVNPEIVANNPDAAADAGILAMSNPNAAADGWEMNHFTWVGIPQGDGYEYNCPTDERGICKFNFYNRGKDAVTFKSKEFLLLNTNRGLSYSRDIISDKPGEGTPQDEWYAVKSMIPTPKTTPTPESTGYENPRVEAALASLLAVRRLAVQKSLRHRDKSGGIF